METCVFADRQNADLYRDCSITRKTRVFVIWGNQKSEAWNMQFAAKKACGAITVMILVEKKAATSRILVFRLKLSQVS